MQLFSMQRRSKSLVKKRVDTGSNVCPIKYILMTKCKLEHAALERLVIRNSQATVSGVYNVSPLMIYCSGLETSSVCE